MFQKLSRIGLGLAAFAAVLMLFVYPAVAKQAFENLSEKVASGDYVNKVDNFVVVLDLSHSMADSYQGKKKLDIARDTLEAMNELIPDLPLVVALRLCGGNLCPPDMVTYRISGPEAYKKSEFARVLSDVGRPSGNAPVSLAIEAVGRDLEKMDGKTAVFLVSDGVGVRNDAIDEVTALRANHDEDVALYTIWVGDYSRGHYMLDLLANAGGTGQVYAASELEPSPDAMAQLVETAFLTEAPEPEEEEDRPDFVVSSIHFEFDRAELRPSAYPVMDEVVLAMTENELLEVIIEGHTDNIGTMQYNLGLSRERAAAARDYLVEHGIDADRVDIEGYWFSRPVASNDTEEGRAENRRVEFRFVDPVE